MIGKIDHLGIAVSSINDTLKYYLDAFGLKAEDIEIETVEEQNAKVAMIPVAGSRIELLESTDPEGVIAKYIERKGEGIHHVALEVSDIQGMLETLKKKGVPLIDEKPRIGAGGAKIAFLHPKGTRALIELVEH